jgi:hypothetical protein
MFLTIVICTPEWNFQKDMLVDLKEISNLAGKTRAHAGLQQP